MYQCTFCRKSVGPKVPCKKHIVTRLHHHPVRTKAQKKWVKDKMTNRMKVEWSDDVGGVGSQIVAEYPICEQCEKNIPNKY